MAVSPEMQGLLHDGERVVWTGRPDGGVWIAARLLFLGVIALFVAVPLLVLAGFMGGSSDAPMLLFLWPGLLILFLLFLIFLFQLWWYTRLLYMFTPTRVILQRGLIGRDFEIVDFNRVTDYSLRVGVMDKLFGRGTGSIQIKTASDAVMSTGYAYGNRRRVLENVPEAYAVQKRMLRLRDEALAQEGPAVRRGARDG